jgi:hypothetical protein
LYNARNDLFRAQQTVIDSRRFKSSFQTALAMTIAYGISLAMDWDKPLWAAFAVAFISMSTVEDSLSKAGQRLFGTVVAAAVALAIIAVSAQDRWLFMILLSGWVALCTSMMTGARHQYFWFVGGFVTAIICMNTDANALNAFSTAMLRMQQTGLGILVYTVVATLVWPARKIEESAEEGIVDATASQPVKLLPAAKIATIFWLGYFAIIYIPDFPGGLGFMAMLTPVGMNAAAIPQFRAVMLVPPAAVSISLAALCYIFFMPGLSTFAGLGSLIFAATFVVCYLFYEPQKALGRAFGLGLFSAVCAINNQQAYNFLTVANTALMFSILILLLYLVENLPWQQPAATVPGSA